MVRRDLRFAFDKVGLLRMPATVAADGTATVSWRVPRAVADQASHLYAQALVAVGGVTGTVGYLTGVAEQSVPK